MSVHIASVSCAQDSLELMVMIMMMTMTVVLAIMIVGAMMVVVEPFHFVLYNQLLHLIPDYLEICSLLISQLRVPALWQTQRMKS